MTLGAGISYRPELRAAIFQSRASFAFLEIIADHYLDPTYETRRELALLAEHFTLIPHALGLSLGSADGLDETYLAHLKSLIDFVAPPWWSEHISFTRIGEVDIGHLTPLPYREEAVEAFAANVARVREVIDAPLILENVAAPLAAPGATMSELEFVCAVLERTDCGMLLDVANLYANATNHGYDAAAFMRALPAGRIVQLHLAGGCLRDGIVVDSHDREVAPPVWELAARAIGHAPVRAVCIERDHGFEPVEALIAEVQHAQALGALHGRWT